MTKKVEHYEPSAGTSPYPNKCVCGNHARVLEDWIDCRHDSQSHEHITYSVRCSKCKINTPWYEAYTSAVNRWNSMELVFNYDPDEYPEITDDEC